MGSKSGKDPEQGAEQGAEQAAEQGLPPEIIAQAEAAMYANLMHRRPGLPRSKSEIDPSSSQRQHTGASQASDMRENRLTR
jgi:hypothetical protein